MTSKERFLRNRAKKAGYKIHKGFVHYMHNGSVFIDQYGNRESGYSVLDLTTGYYIWGCYNEALDNLWTIEDVENFLKTQYRAIGLDW
jgi:hypothetical protein